MFTDLFSTYDWSEVKASIYAKTGADVERALSKAERNLEDFKALISPAAKQYLEPMAIKSRALTQQRFGKNIQMYIPMYLSNECQNICTYCGFSMDNKLPRKTLSDKEILKEVAAIKAMGYEHVLLLTGEANNLVGFDYLYKAVQLIKPHFAQVSLEVQPLKQSEYEVLIEIGLHAVYVYQESYRRETYKKYHPKGRKSNFDWRLETPDRLGKAGIHKIGIGALLGLEDWRTESFMTAIHLEYLRKYYWESKYSISFPRLRPAEGSSNDESVMDESDLLQLICAYRILDPDLELSMSTRETSHFRDHIVSLGVTSMSADSKTAPGGYAVNDEALEQFEIDDNRSAAEVSEMISKQGYTAVWKDWDSSYQLLENFTDNS